MVAFPFYNRVLHLTIPGFPVLYEHHVCLPLFFRESFAHQPHAEYVRVICVQPEGNGYDDFKRVNIRVQAVFKLNVAAYLVIVQYVRLTDGFPVFRTNNCNTLLSI
jgi:hypothetical protein